MIFRPVSLIESSAGRLCRAAVLLLALAAAGGCAGYLRQGLTERTASRPGAQWVPPPMARIRPDTVRPAVELPAGLLQKADSLTLELIVDITLQNNPDTRASWASAKAAAARLGSEKGAYYPQLDASAQANRAQGSVAGGRFSYNQIAFGPAVTLNFLLFDFGKREADVESARQDLYASNWTHNATLQNVVLRVERAYFQYLYAKALRQARQQSVEEARENLEAAEQRRKAGLATITDVLQARTNRSQALLAFQEVDGQVKTIRGALATAMGLPADIAFDVGFLPNELPVEMVSETIDKLMAQAENRRPDLAAARARVRQAEADLASVRAEDYPSFSIQGSLGRDYFNSRDRYSDNKRASIMLSVPLFTGFSRQNDVLESQADLERSQGEAEALRRQVILDVWISYYDLQTAAQRMDTSRELLATATESHQASQERYRVGVGSILELLTAQAALEDARAQDVAARTDWLLALAQLAHDTGNLWTYEPGQPAVDNKQGEKSK